MSSRWGVQLAMLQAIWRFCRPLGHPQHISNALGMEVAANALSALPAYDISPYSGLYPLCIGHADDAVDVNSSAVFHLASVNKNEIATYCLVGNALETSSMRAGVHATMPAGTACFQRACICARSHACMHASVQACVGV